METRTITAISCPNIAFIKYWGNRNQELRIPSTGSISMNLEGLYTRTQVTFEPDLKSDSLAINDSAVQGKALERVSTLLDRVRKLAGIAEHARVESASNFPAGTGIASSASAFAAIALASSAAAGLDLSERDLSRLARTGSGSACRSVPGGFVEWQAGENDEDSFAYSIAPPEHWDLVDLVAILNRAHKPTGSAEGHTLAASSPLQAARVADAPRRLDLCRRAILERDFNALADVVEQDSNMMHAVMLTSIPRLIYWLPATLAVMRSVEGWRKDGLPALYTIDAGPNVHVITTAQAAAEVAFRLKEIPGVEEILIARPGGPAHVLNIS